METLLSLKNIGKSFPGVRALDGIDLDLERGEVHALLGENGAGKSTLVKIIAGVYSKDQGSVFFDGQEREFSSPASALNAGIAVIHQETSLIPTLTVVQNIFLGIEHTRAFRVIDERRIRQEYDRICEEFGFRLPLATKARLLTIAEQKMTEILKAMVRKASFVIMDEPTDALTGPEISHLFQIIRGLKKNGVTVLYITHYLDEVFQITDRLTVLRDGRKVATVQTSSVDRNGVVRMMIGTELAIGSAQAAGSRRGPEAIRVERIGRKGFVSEVSFSAYQGEILGITGVLGSGKTELARLLFAADKLDSGGMFVGGREFVPRSPRDAVRNGIGMLPEDRKSSGLILEHELYKNLSLVVLNRFRRGPVLSRARELEAVGKIVEQLDIKTTGYNQQTKLLSGGNQQKTVVGKWLLSHPRVLIMDEPTRGIDVGSKAEIHRIMRELADQGTCILFISSEVQEIIAISDRILVMRSGKIAAEFERGASQEKIIRSMLQGEAS
jgi:ABC-type sugar transport system ATPase subunit